MKKTLLYYVLFFSFLLILTACGKEDKLEGNKYKAYVNGRMEAELTFEKDEVVVTGQTKLDGESLEKYKLKTHNNKTYLEITSPSATNIFDEGVRNTEGTSYYTWKVENKDNKTLILQPLMLNKDGETLYKSNLDYSRLIVDDEYHPDLAITLKKVE